jgi:sulfoxide reductase heme-binding subunit YedZ
MASTRPLVFPPGPVPWLVPAVVTGGAVPLLGIVAGLYRHTLGADPVAEALNELGLLALVFLVASLACTPLKALTGWTWPIRVRRALGLYGFFYASVHLVTYAGIDQFLDLRAIVRDVVERPFVLVGFTAFVLLVPLAITSSARMVKRLGFARWKRLHRLAYVAAALGVVHFFLRVKRDVTEPAIYGSLLAALFAVRIAVLVKERGTPSVRDARHGGARG